MEFLDATNVVHVSPSSAQGKHNGLGKFILRYSRSNEATDFSLKNCVARVSQLICLANHPMTHFHELTDDNEVLVWPTGLVPHVSWRTNDKSLAKRSSIPVARGQRHIQPLITSMELRWKAGYNGGSEQPRLPRTCQTFAFCSR